MLKFNVDLTPASLLIVFLRAMTFWTGALSWSTPERCPGSTSPTGGASRESSSCLITSWSCVKRFVLHFLLLLLLHLLLLFPFLRLLLFLLFFSSLLLLFFSLYLLLLLQSHSMFGCLLKAHIYNISQVHSSVITSHPLSILQGPWPFNISWLLTSLVINYKTLIYCLQLAFSAMTIIIFLWI